jgi:uncharacterized membrane protein YqgA involved in biofilm formation
VFVFEHFLGTLVNFVVVIITGIIGTFVKKSVPKRIQDSIMAAMAICVIYIGIDGILEPAPAVADGLFLTAGLKKVLIMILSMAIGTFIGELIDIDAQLHKLGAFLGRKLTRTDTEDNASASDNFARGLVSCSLLFCVGAMAINGAIHDATGEPNILLAKSIIDGISCFMLATTFGIGCAFSAFFVLAYQGSISALTLLLTSFVSEAGIQYMSMTGSLIIVLVGTNVLGATKVKTANMVPAMFVALGIEALINLF